MNKLDKAYNFLSDNNIHWNRRDDNTIVVWSSGYRTQEVYEIEKTLMPLGLFCLSMDFDSMCGKTKAVFRHK